jgi:sterol 3beta-glucosyltransferase
MRVLIPTIGSRGDVQPFIALAQGLERAGHAVTLMTHPHMHALVKSYGVSFASLGPNIDLAQEAAAIRARSSNVWLGLIRAMRMSFDVLERSHADIQAVCWDMDLVVVPVQSAAGKNEADLAGVPHVSVSFMPWGLPYKDPARLLLKRIFYAAMDSAVGAITTRPLNRARRRLGLPPVGPEGFTSKRLNLVPISPSVYPPNPLWDPRHRVVGYWFVEDAHAWEPPSDLEAFLGSGTPPVVVSLGAMSYGGDETLETAKLFVDAIKAAGVRAIIQGWDHALSKLKLPPSILAAGSIPHSWLLPCAAGLVHHGGFGTTAAGIRAGIPQLIIPHMVDQFYWGKRVEELGIGLPMIVYTKLEVDGLAAALRSLAEDDRLRSAATNLGEQVRSESGVDEAVRLIELLMRDTKSFA